MTNGLLAGKVVLLVGASTGIGVSSACNFVPAIVYRRSASVSGRQSASHCPTQRPMLARSSVTPSRAAISDCRYSGA